MRIELAERLLVKIMEWTSEEVSEERPLLQALANFKFDEYQQFTPGIRFIESLAQWLNQFEIIEERKTAYGFVKKHLIFISNNQISQLVNLSFSTLIRPLLVKKVAIDINENKYFVRKIISSQAYKDTLRQSLFIGLSDGSKIDQLRRFAQLNNEQVLTSFFVDEEKINDLTAELVRYNNTNKFTSIFLVDDFTASGTSYARLESNGLIKGKIIKLLKKIFIPDENGKLSHLSRLFDSNSLSIHVVFYIATDDALKNIEDIVSKFTEENNINLSFTIDAVQRIDNSVKESILNDSQLIDLIKQPKYFDESIIDKHFTISGKTKSVRWPVLSTNWSQEQKSRRNRSI